MTIEAAINAAGIDHTTFEAIEIQVELKQQDVIKLMRTEMQPRSFNLWRERTKGCRTILTP
jgi:uncharacterized protein (TIGR03643 family)